MAVAVLATRLSGQPSTRPSVLLLDLQRYASTWRTEGRASPCIEWAGSVDKDGYGLVCSNGKTHRTHRLAWEIAHARAAAGLCVLHRCDNPPCFNLDHLFTGTRADNNRDRSAKGRDTRHNAKLSVRQAEQVREALEAGGPRGFKRRIAEKFGVSPRAIAFIERGQTYKLEAK